MCDVKETSQVFGSSPLLGEGSYCVVCLETHFEPCVFQGGTSDASDIMTEAAVVISPDSFWFEATVLVLLEEDPHKAGNEGGVCLSDSMEVVVIRVVK